MTEIKPQRQILDRWFMLTVLSWLAICAYLLYLRWNQIYWFALGDTDDNMRLMQVRALLNGQDWFDLRQYRLNPPDGANIHWSRFVDLPLAGLILFFKPFIGGAKAEYVAIAIAPLLPLLVGMTGLALAVRRLVANWAPLLAFVIMLFCQAALGQFFPTRIDHHGWQLAFLPWLVVGIADPARRRGGLIIGVASALSLAIGLEMLPYLAITAAMVVLRWLLDLNEASRLRAFGLALGIGTGLAYLVFASIANRESRCDVLSPVWLSVAMAGGGLVVLLAMVRVSDWRLRLLAALAAGGLLAVGFVLLWPHCLGRPEGISPELDRLWFSQIREVAPVYEKEIDILLPLAFSAIVGPVGAAFAMVRARGTDRFEPWAATLLLSLCSGALLLWQTRAGSAVQILSIPGATALGAWLLPKLRDSNNMLVRVFGTVAGFALISGMGVQLALIMKPVAVAKDGKPKKDLSSLANSQCATIPSLAPIARMPRATIFTFVDLSPRLITLTHHNAIAGPYHRNGQAILDVQHAFRGSPEDAEPIIRTHGARYVLICPNSSESTIYAKERPNGFYAQLAKGKVPKWLNPVPLPAQSPYRMWEVTPPLFPNGG